MTERVDCVVIGAGVVGLAIARALARAGREVLVLERESATGTGTSSRNSEVIHAGIYYPGGSLKARLCVAGRDALYRYCEEKNVAHRRIGKIIVATSGEQMAELHKYAERAAANGVRDLRWLTAEEVHELEPNVHCVAALLSPSTGIVNSHELMLAYQADIESCGGAVVLNSPVTGGALGRDGITLEVAGQGSFTLLARAVVNSAGLAAQEVSRSLKGIAPHTIPQRFLAKGHYFTLAGRSPFSRLVYPIADSAGLGVHVTLDLQGRVRFGPDVEWVEEIDYRVDESRRAAFAEAIRSYYPQLQESQLQPAYAGIRPKISGRGQPPADFCVHGPAEHGGAPYVALYGIESPGLTASLALAEHVAGVLGEGGRSAGPTG